MRQLVSTVLVACIVGALAGASVSALAQQPIEQGPIQPPAATGPGLVTAGLNADTVDHKHAVGAKVRVPQRRNRLVATDRTGFLPSNIVKPLWGLIKGKPTFLADGLVGWDEVENKPVDLADGVIGWGEVKNKPVDLADGVIGWNEVENKPAGFADGVDDAGVTGVTIIRKQATVTVTGGPGGGGGFSVNCGLGEKLVGGGFDAPGSLNVTESYPQSATSWWIGYTYLSAVSSGNITGYVICITTQPSDAISTARQTGRPARVESPKKAMDRRGQ